MARKQDRMSAIKRREAISGYLYLLPNFISLLIFIAIPVVVGLAISFTDYNGFQGVSFVWLANYGAIMAGTVISIIPVVIVSTPLSRNILWKASPIRA
jgi:ABC-type sugar transport system permease subunit